MKPFFLLACAVFSMTGAALSQTIKMKIASITPAAGETVLAYQGSNSFPVSVNGTAGQVSFEAIKIKKLIGMSSNELFKRSTIGSSLPEVDFEFYDSSNALFYKIVLKNVLVSSMAYLSPECSNCSTLSQQIGFNFKQIEVTNVATGVTTGFNLSTNQSY